MTSVYFVLAVVSAAEAPYYPAVSVHAKGVGQLLHTVFNWSLVIVGFMTKKSMDQKAEVKIVIRFYFVKQRIDKLP